MILTITHTHWKAARAHEKMNPTHNIDSNCPLAQALTEAGFLYASVNLDKIMWGSVSNRITIQPTKGMKAIIRAYDNYERITLPKRVLI